MKTISFIFLLLLLISCQQPSIIEEYYLQNPYNTTVVNKVIFPEPLTRSNSPFTSVQDWTNGIIYKENAKSYDSLIHTLDLGYLTGGKQALVYLEVKVIDHGYDYFRSQYDDSSGAIYLREKNSLASWQSVMPRYNVNTSNILLVTDEFGAIEWYHDHNVNYWDNPTCEPGYEIYKWEKIIITCKWYSLGITVK